MAADPRFFPCAGPQTLAAIAAAAGTSFEADGQRRFIGVAGLASATAEQVSFLDTGRYRAQLEISSAGLVLVTADMAARVPVGTLAMVVASPALAFARVARLFHPSWAAVPGIHPSAVVAADAELGAGCEIGALAVIGARAKLGPGCVIGPQAVVGEGVELGPACRLHPHASISHAIAGAGVVLHPGARIGQEGFGLVVTAEGSFETTPQLGLVRLGDGVEVGANSTIDRGALGDTVIGPGTRIDNLVQIAHNVRTGKNCVIVAMAGIAGSTTLGDYVTVAAQVGVAGHLTIGSKARIGAQAGVMHDIPPGVDMLGTPALPFREAMRSFVAIRKLAQPPASKKTGDTP